MVSVFDTAAAILAGFVIVPSAFSGGVDIQSAGPSLVFNVMTDIFEKLPADASSDSASSWPSSSP